MIDVKRFRSETPGCSRVIHFNNAGSSLMPDAVFDAVREHLELEREIGGYEALQQNIDAHDRFYGSLADLLNCTEGEIAYVENATRAWDMAFYSVSFEPGDRIVTAQAEYASNYLAFLQAFRKLRTSCRRSDRSRSGRGLRPGRRPRHHMGTRSVS